jgi:hypothetical protein
MGGYTYGFFCRSYNHLLPLQPQNRCLKLTTRKGNHFNLQNVVPVWFSVGLINKYKFLW